MTRDGFIEHQVEHANDKFGFTDGEEEARERFLQLAPDTYDALTAAGAVRIWTIDPCPEVARNALSRLNRAGGAKLASSSPRR